MMAALKIKTGPVLMNIPCPVIWGLVFFPPHLTGKGLKGEAGAYRNPVSRSGVLWTLHFCA